MRCEHMVEKTNPFTKKRRLRACRHRLKSSERRLHRGLTWHVYRCRRGHETRFYVGPDATGPSGQFYDGQ